MKKNNLKRGCAIAVGIYLAVAVAFYFIAGDALFYKTAATDMVNAAAICPSLQKGDSLTQWFVAKYHTVEALKLKAATYGRVNHDILSVCISDDAEQLVCEQKIDTSTMADNSEYTVTLEKPLTDAKGKSFRVELTSLGGTESDGVSFYYGNSVSTARANVSVELSEKQLLLYNGEPLNGTLCLSVVGTRYFLAGSYYWFGTAVLGLLLIGYCLYLLFCDKKGKNCKGLQLIADFHKYRFLIEQLVSRDFKTKYKRSILGACWSFLNPLLTMLVQYVVFSTIFKSSIENFPVYLLSGIICFNFFNEVSAMCLGSIVNNGSLITKVYMPKYIYPVSRALSSCINFLLSLVPLLLVLFITRTPITPAILLLAFGILCLLFFSLGIGMLLAALMTFFRDTQFLWNVISMLWVYATPIFYPENIIPARFLPVYRLNPMYHIVGFFRTVLIEGVSPAPTAYLYCLLAAILAMTLGTAVFCKTQDKFVLYL